MTVAKISEIFTSIQGEGMYAGARQLFIRFYGCRLNCAYCDTKLSSFRQYTKEGLLDDIMKCDQPYHSISLTGGEPLEQTDFLCEFLPFLKSNMRKSVYLETNGVLYENMARIIGLVDIIAMDMKLPSVTRQVDLWNEHRRFLEIARSKEVFVKVIVTAETDHEDMLMARRIVRSVDFNIPMVIQPVDEIGDIKAPPVGSLVAMKKKLAGHLPNVSIMPQWHKITGIK